MSCTGLHTFGDMNALDIIDEYAFKGCDKLETVGRMDALHTIGYGAFLGCTALRHFHIPQTMDMVFRRAFSGCDQLRVTVASGDFSFICADETLRAKIATDPRVNFESNNMVIVVA